jgi:hypothetical protein
MAGVTAIDTSVGPPTPSIVREVDPETAPEVAVMVVAPEATPVARPLVLMVAAPVLVEVHVSRFELLRFAVLLSL